jgi:LysM repeat protein
MLSRLLIGLALAATAFAQNASPQVELANLREDVRGLAQRVGDLTLRLEQLERENAELRRKSADGARAYATVAQLDQAVADLNRTVKSSVSTSQNETLQIVGTQLEKLGRQTNAALESLAKSQAVRPVSTPSPALSSPPVPSGDGGTYTVQKGDSLASIAKKTGAKQQDIVTANKLSDPSLIKVGQTLIIPGAK